MSQIKWRNCFEIWNVKNNIINHFMQLLSVLPWERISVIYITCSQCKGVRERERVHNIKEEFSYLLHKVWHSSVYKLETGSSMPNYTHAFLFSTFFFLQLLLLAMEHFHFIIVRISFKTLALCRGERIFLLWPLSFCILWRPLEWMAAFTIE